MQEKIVKCPNPKCGVVLKVENSKNEEVKQITCPKCKTPLVVKFAPQQQPVEAPTFYGYSVEGATQLDSPISGVTQLAGPVPQALQKPKLECDGNYYLLEEGQNIIGRKGTTSKATVQIETADRYMSRQHCSIMVRTLPDGTKKAVLSNYQNKNLTAVNGQEVATGDEIRLADGDSIKMGHTSLIFKM